MSFLNKLPQVFNCRPLLHRAAGFTEVSHFRDIKTGLFSRSNLMTQEVRVKHFILQYLVTVLSSTAAGATKEMDMTFLTSQAAVLCTAVPEIWLLRLHWGEQKRTPDSWLRTEAVCSSIQTSADGKLQSGKN